MRHCDCSNKADHDPWCVFAEDFKQTAEMIEGEKLDAVKKAANDARFDEVVAIIGTAWGLWEKVIRNPEMNAAQIADAIKAGRL